MVDNCERCNVYSEVGDSWMYTTHVKQRLTKIIIIAANPKLILSHCLRSIFFFFTCLPSLSLYPSLSPNSRHIYLFYVCVWQWAFYVNVCMYTVRPGRHVNSTHMRLSLRSFYHFKFLIYNTRHNFWQIH